MRNLCIIPARGGSKRIPRKNVKDFLGKPVIAYSIEVALTCGLFETVMVSTEDDEIAETAIRYGASVPFMRTEATASDYATTADVLTEVLENYQAKGTVFEKVCCLYPTAPLVTAASLRSGFEVLTDEFDSVFPIVAFGFPVRRGLRIDEFGKVQMIWPEYMNTRSQDLEPVYHDAGQWYWFRYSSFKTSGRVYGDNSRGVIVDELSVQDIDSPSDWSIAELKYRLAIELGKAD